MPRENDPSNWIFIQEKRDKKIVRYQVIQQSILPIRAYFIWKSLQLIVPLQKWIYWKKKSKIVKDLGNVK